AGGGRRDPAQRAQRQPDEDAADDPGEQQGAAEDRERRDLDLPQRRLHAGEREPGDEYVVVVAGNRGQPVVAVERVEVQRGEVAGGRQVRQRGLARGRQPGLAADDALRGDDAVLDPRAEGARRLAGDRAAVLLPGRGSRRVLLRGGIALVSGVLDRVVRLH